MIPYEKINTKLTDDGKTVQERLREYGYDIPNTEYGIYGKITKSAIQSFQLHCFGTEILSNEALRADWENVYHGKDGTLLCQFNENHQKCLDDVLNQFIK